MESGKGKLGKKRVTKTLNSSFGRKTTIRVCFSTTTLASVIYFSDPQGPKFGPIPNGI